MTIVERIFTEFARKNYKTIANLAIIFKHTLIFFGKMHENDSTIMIFGVLIDK